MPKVHRICRYAALFAVALTVGCASDAGVAPTTVPDRVAEAAEHELFMDRMAECMTEHGFPATDNGDGGVRVEVAPGQDEAYDAAIEACQQSQQPPEVSELTDAEVRSLYDQSVEAYECLQQLGYRPTEPVSFEVFLNQYRNVSESAPWSPFVSTEQRGPLPDSVCKQPTLAPGTP